MILVIRDAPARIRLVFYIPVAYAYDSAASRMPRQGDALAGYAWLVPISKWLPQTPDSIMRVCLIFNPGAGTAERIKDFLLHLTGEHRCELRPTAAGGDAGKIAGEAVGDGFDRIIVAGGDGTVGEVVNGIAPDFDAVQLAILPFGTGNDLARLLGVYANDMEAACDVAFRTRCEAIDLIKITGTGRDTAYCVNVANGGLGGCVAVDVKAEDKRRWGPLAYWMTSVSALVKLQEFQVQLVLDGEKSSFMTRGIAVANGRYVGGGFPIAPHAILNDGLLDITVVPVLSSLELMAAGSNFILGHEDRADHVKTFVGTCASIRSSPAMPFSIDGEASKSLDATFEIVPRVLHVATGELS